MSMSEILNGLHEFKIAQARLLPQRYSASKPDARQARTFHLCIN
jgi:hypothetical protein